ncbi:hypothetical protein DFH06DRAFT_509201 [Mycena polygramma]|nr:hypothetical protein DFH06DRAFT_509201 [Mycena polygramma]
MDASRELAAVLTLRQPEWPASSTVDLVLRGPVAVAAPGRILNETYHSLGLFAERHANRASYRLGFGPVAVVERIERSMSEGQQREVRLQEIRNNVDPKLKRDCSKLIGYAFPFESPRTQIEAFKGIMTLITRYSGLRRVFLASQKLGAAEISGDSIAALWKRPDSEDAGQSQDFTFFLEYASACITDKDVAPMMEENPPHVLWSVEDGLSVVERLLVASDCEGSSNFSSAVSIRYLAGILECPLFWAQFGPMFEAILKKIFARTVAILKDLGIDCEDFDAPKVTSDPEGIDNLCESILTGIQNSKLQACPIKDYSAQYWYPGLSDIIKLLRHPNTEYALPKSWAHATSAEMKTSVPTAYILQGLPSVLQVLLICNHPERV